jgi:hypothetical protein
LTGCGSAVGWAIRSSSVITTHRVERRLPVRRIVPEHSSSRN